MSETKKSDGGAAFPGEKGTRFGQPNDCNEGMSLRDYFAGQALAGIMAHRPNTAEVVASAAYELADAMLLARGEQ